MGIKGGAKCNLKCQERKGFSNNQTLINCTRHHFKSQNWKKSKTKQNKKAKKGFLPIRVYHNMVGPFSVVHVASIEQKIRNEKIKQFIIGTPF